MTDNLRKAAQLAIDTIEHNDILLNDAAHNALNNLRAALAETGEPVAWATDTPYGRGYSYSDEFIAAHSNFQYPVKPPLGVESILYVYSGPQGVFYAPIIEQGEIILSLMNVDEEEWTGTRITNGTVDALIAELEGLGAHHVPNHSDEYYVQLKKLKAVLSKYK